MVTFGQLKYDLRVRLPEYTNIRCLRKALIGAFEALNIKMRRLFLAPTSSTRTWKSARSNTRTVCRHELERVICDHIYLYRAILKDTTLGTAVNHRMVRREGVDQ